MHLGLGIRYRGSGSNGAILSPAIGLESAVTYVHAQAGPSRNIAVAYHLNGDGVEGDMVSDLMSKMTSQAHFELHTPILKGQKPSPTSYIFTSMVV